MKTLARPLTLWIAICTSAQAIVTSDGPGTHVVSQMTHTYGVNLDGVALIGGVLPAGPTGFCSGALITDAHVLTTARCVDANRDLQIDPNLFMGPSEVLLEINGDWTVLGYDPAKIVWSDDWATSRNGMAIVTLEENPSGDVPRYALYGGNAEVGQPFVLAGYGLAGFGPTGIDPDFDPVRTKRAGLNQYDALDVRALDVADAQFLVSDFDSGQAEHNSLVDLGFGADEVLAAPYDSGGPGFLDGALASVVAFGRVLPEVDATDRPDGSWGEHMYSNRVSAYQDFILTATDGLAVFVMPGEPSILGDFDHDQLLTANDIDLLSRAIRFGIDHASLDVSEDGAVNHSDREMWIQDLFGTFYGDADLNRTVELADFLAMSESFGRDGGWADGDFDGSGDVRFADFLILSENFDQSLSELATVPEPSGLSLSLIVGLVLIRTVQLRRDK